MDDLDARIDALYAGPPGAFTAGRNALAKTLKERGRTDEAARVGAVLATLKSHPGIAEVILVDDGSTDGTWRVGTAGSDARGFLIQATGALRGKTMLARGTIILKSPLLGGRSRTIQLDVETADGAFVRGKLTARPDSIAVREFETRRSGDVAALWGDAAAGLAADELGRRSMPGQPLSGTAPDGGASNSARP